MMFKNRLDAGKQLGKLLITESATDCVLYAIPSGGIPVAMGAAREMGSRFDLVLVKKLAYPWSPETAYGAIALDGSEVLSPSVSLRRELSEEEMAAVRASALQRLREQESRLLRGRKTVVLKDKRALVVDDGVATGYTTLAAVQFLRHAGYARVGIATPVAPEDTRQHLAPLVDGFFAILVVQSIFFAVGSYYEDFCQYQEEDLVKMLREAQEEGLYPLVESGGSTYA
jgi:putative phosphoribosyl transferase